MRESVRFFVCGPVFTDSVSWVSASLIGFTDTKAGVLLPIFSWLTLFATDRPSTQISLAAWRHILLNGHSTFHNDGKVIDLETSWLG
jgi:hypothetical protein